jgi:hypothetical protein
MTATHEQAPELATPLGMGALATGVVNLLQEADRLEQPGYITISDTQHITLAFETLRAIARWARQFGGTLRSEGHDTSRGPEIWATSDFIYCGVGVHAYAMVPDTSKDASDGHA